VTDDEPDYEIPLHRLPEGFAEAVRRTPDHPAQPRPAATIVLMRDGLSGLEVLLLRRTRSAGFVPGAYVFPGGRVDPLDADPELLERLDGLTAQDAAERLHLGATPATRDVPAVPAVAYYVAALREAFEETGILVARAGGGAPPTAAEDPTVDAVRDDLLEHRITFAQALDRLGCRLDGRAVEYLAHWITPVVEPRRYDTRFFAARVHGRGRVVIDAREMTDAVWITPADALQRQHEGSLPMVFPTIRTLEQLAAYDTVDAALAELGLRRVPAILPDLVVTPTGVGLRLPQEVKRIERSDPDAGIPAGEG